MRRITGAAGLLAAALLVSGCDGGGAAKGAPDSTASSAPATASPSSPSSPTPSSSPSPSPSGAPTSALAPAPTGKVERLVAATMTGGIDGRHESVIVRGDGSYTRLGRGKPDESGRLTPAELATLRKALSDADFPRLPRISMGDPVPDGRVYAIIYGGREVVTGDPAPPPALGKVISALPFADQ
ncbi:hypothetical protein ACWGI8_41125 [Streptomyces sp. NPDC054841]